MLVSDVYVTIMMGQWCNDQTSFAHSFSADFEDVRNITEGVAVPFRNNIRKPSTSDLLH